MVKKWDLWDLSLIKKTAWKRSWDDKEGCTTCYSYFFPLLLPIFLLILLMLLRENNCLSQMNTNVMPDYRRKRRRIEEHVKRPNKPISISWYRVTLGKISRKKVVTILTFFPAFETQKDLCKNTCRDSRDKKKESQRIFWDYCDLYKTLENVAETFDMNFLFINLIFTRELSRCSKNVRLSSSITNW